MTVRVRNLTRNAVVAGQAAVAETPLQRMKGLLGSKELASGSALVITSCRSVHMLFMRYAIDVIFLDGDNRVVGLCPNLAPFAFSPIFWKSACAIELPAGTIQQTGAELGDQFSIA